METFVAKYNLTQVVILTYASLHQKYGLQSLYYGCETGI